MSDTVEVRMNDSIGTLDHNALALRMKINQGVLPVATREMLIEYIIGEKSKVY